MTTSAKAEVSQAGSALKPHFHMLTVFLDSLTTTQVTTSPALMKYNGCSKFR